MNKRITPIELRERATLIKSESPGRCVTAAYLRKAADRIHELEAFISEIGRANRIEWWDDLVTDPASYVKSILDPA